MEVMKTAGKFEQHSAKPTWKFRRMLAVATGSTLAIGYCLAAQQDKKNGFPLTAAMEWRKAAELFAPISLVSNRCWHEWERIMHLPRHLAVPIGDSREIVLQYPSAPNICAVSHAIVNELPLAVAA